MGSSPTKPNIKTAPTPITNTPLYMDAMSLGEHPENDLLSQSQEDLASSVNASDSDMSCTDQTGQKFFESSVNASKSGMSSTDQTGQKDTELVPVVDQSRKNHSNPNLTGRKRCKIRHIVKFPSRNIYDKITRPKNYKNIRPLLKQFLSSSEIFKLFDYSTRSKCFNSLVCRTIIACPVVLGPRTCSDSGLISHVNGFPWALMEHEVFRVLTFLCYPVAMARSPLPVARSGFVYIGDGETDRIICFFCLEIVENWQEYGSLEEFHVVTCRRRMTSEETSMIDMTALTDFSALRLRLPSGSSVGTHTLPDESGQRPNLSSILSGVISTHLVVSTADEASTGERPTMGAEATLVDTRTSGNEQTKQGDARSAAEATKDEEAELAVDAPTDEEAELAVEATTDEEAELTVGAPTNEEAELTVGAPTDEEAELTVGAPTDEEAELTVGAPTDEEAELTVELSEGRGPLSGEVRTDRLRATEDLSSESEASIGRSSTTETMSPTRTTETMSPTRTTQTMSPTRMTETMSPTRTTQTMSPTRTIETMSPTRMTETMSPTRMTETMSPTRTTETMSPTRTTETMSPTRMTETMSPTRTTQTMSPTNNISSVRRRPSELTNIMEAIQENEVATILTNFHAPAAINTGSNSRRHSCCSPIVRPRMTRRGSV